MLLPSSASVAVESVDGEESTSGAAITISIFRRHQNDIDVVRVDGE
jgi:hypothetical protein